MVNVTDFFLPFGPAGFFATTAGAMAAPGWVLQNVWGGHRKEEGEGLQQEFWQTAEANLPYDLLRAFGLLLCRRMMQLIQSFKFPVA